MTEKEDAANRYVQQLLDFGHNLNGLLQAYIMNAFIAGAEWYRKDVCIDSKEVGYGIASKTT